MGANSSTGMINLDCKIYTTVLKNQMQTTLDVIIGEN